MLHRPRDNVYVIEMNGNGLRVRHGKGPRSAGLGTARRKVKARRESCGDDRHGRSVLVAQQMINRQMIIYCCTEWNNVRSVVFQHYNQPIKFLRRDYGIQFTPCLPYWTLSEVFLIEVSLIEGESVVPGTNLSRYNFSNKSTKVGRQFAPNDVIGSKGRGCPIKGQPSVCSRNCVIRSKDEQEIMILTRHEVRGLLQKTVDIRRTTTFTLSHLGSKIYNDRRKPRPSIILCKNRQKLDVIHQQLLGAASPNAQPIWFMESLKDPFSVQFSSCFMSMT
ncbi:hypothetical protein J6590_000568 [Homalodisca vitripennis]|nr:hypothetical protein J6590_000568 [Homalodisca vitripennis]